MENESAPTKTGTLYVGLETNLRKPALFLSDDWGALSGCLNVPQSLALADNMLRCGIAVPGGGFGRIVEAS
jgi:hypothetical protein